MRYQTIEFVYHGQNSKFEGGITDKTDKKIVEIIISCQYGDIYKVSRKEKFNKALKVEN